MWLQAVVVFLCALNVGAADLPRVLFFSNPMQSDNDVIRRPAPNTFSVAETNFARLAKGVFNLTLTQDGADVSAEKLKQHDAVIFFTAINPPGVDVDGLIEWVKAGGAFVGIHSAANTYQGHPGFGELLGARYDKRPWRTREAPQTKVRLLLNNASHPATRHLTNAWEVADDIYLFKNFDPAKVQLLLSLDPASLDLTKPGVGDPEAVMPMAWVKTHGAGRVFYTALGDWEQTWRDPKFESHLIEGIRWTIQSDPPSGPKP